MKYYLSTLLIFIFFGSINTLMGQSDEVYLERGIEYFDNRNFDEAMRSFSMAIRLNTRNDEAYFMRGFVKSILQDYEGAIQDYTFAIEINPNNENYYYNRGLDKSSLGDFEGAIQDYSHAIEINPNLASAYKQRAEARLEIEKDDFINNLQNRRNAIQDLTQAIEIDPEFAEAYYLRGKERELSAPEESFKDYSRAIELASEEDNRFHDRLNNYFVARAELKYQWYADFQGAIRDYTHAIEINPYQAYNYYYRGVAKSQLRDYRGAINDYDKAIEIANRDPSAEKLYSLDHYYHSRGLARISLGELNEGCNDLSKAGEMGSTTAYNDIQELCN